MSNFIFFILNLGYVRAFSPMWLVSLEVRPSIYLYEAGNEIPTMGRTPKANLAAQMKELIVQPVSSYPFYVSLEGVLGILRLMGWASMSRPCNELDLYIMPV